MFVRTKVFLAADKMVNAMAAALAGFIRMALFVRRKPARAVTGYPNQLA